MIALAFIAGFVTGPIALVVAAWFTARTYMRAIL